MKTFLLLVFLFGILLFFLVACGPEGNANTGGTEQTKSQQIHVELVSGRDLIPPTADPADYVGGVSGGWGYPDEIGCRMYHNGWFKQTLAKHESYLYKAGNQTLEGPVSVNPNSTILLCPR